MVKVRNWSLTRCLNKAGLQAADAAVVDAAAQLRLAVRRVEPLAERLLLQVVDAAEEAASASN